MGALLRPGVRGRYMRTFLEEVDRLPPDDTRAIRETSAEWIPQIEAAGPITWIPVEANVDMTRAVASALGPRRTHDFFCDLSLKAYETPLMRGLIRSVVALVGHDPGRYLEWFQKGFGLVFRDVGTWDVSERSENHATLQGSRLPDALFSDDVWLDSVASSLHSLFRLAHCEGAVAARDKTRAGRTVTFRMMWEK